MPAPSEKFQDPQWTAKGDPRARVAFKGLTTLWFNTGTLCNLQCRNCYIESSPRNDRLVYLTVEDILPYLNEIREFDLPTSTIGLTGGEPFLNPHIIPLLEIILTRGLTALVLTNAFKVIKRHEKALLSLKERFGEQLRLRISLDHHTQEGHERERGPKTFLATLNQLRWLVGQGFHVSLAGRSLTNETREEGLAAYQKLLHQQGINWQLLGAETCEEDRIVIFPEMDPLKEVPEISTYCWDLLGKSPDQQMCAHERMVVKRKGDEDPVVLPCTLLPYESLFELGRSLQESFKEVPLNHPFCAQFCVLGGASCSRVK